MPYILNKTEKSRVYRKGDRFFVSQIQEKRLCRLLIADKDFDALIGLEDEQLDNLVSAMLQVARNEGAESYYEVTM